MTRLTEVWADVGGTFTDCFVAGGPQRRSLKVLSSGRTPLRVRRVERHQVWVETALDDVDGFWISAQASLVSAAGQRQLRRVIGFDAAEGLIQLDEGFDSQPAPGAAIELEAGLEAPVLAARRLLRVPLSDPLPPLDMRLGTTRGTNALLTRRGAKTALVTTAGFGDLLEIGEQARPDLFALTIRKPVPLADTVIEVQERLDARGQVLRPLDEAAAGAALLELRQQGIVSLAVCLLHGYANDVHERAILRLAEPLGFDNISLSSQVAPLIKLVARAETTVVDAYLNPVLAVYLRRLGDQLAAGRPRSSRAGRLRLMTSAGNLVDAAAFRGYQSILSGPAGGVISLGKVAEAHGVAAAIGLDMGGTSTDVSRFQGRVARHYESHHAGVRVLTPMMAIHTVAAGGGSICDCVHGRMVVGPDSAGADPGPACYGRGGPLTVTDLNVVLGRLPADRFPFPLDIAAARRRLDEVNLRLGSEAFHSLEAAARGFLQIAITHMAEAVRAVSTAEGSDPRQMTLVGFGGAAGGHLCGIAEVLGMTRLIDHRDASLLSALGIGLADIGRVHSAAVYRCVEQCDGAMWQQWLDGLRRRVLEELAAELHGGADAKFERLTGLAEVRYEADCRYQGTESTLTLQAEPRETLAERFHAAHAAAFGYDQRQRGVELAALRCEATIHCDSSLDPPLPDPYADTAGSAPPVPQGHCGGMPVFQRAQVGAGCRLDGPCIVIDPLSTLVVDAGWQATKMPSGSFELVASHPRGFPAPAKPVQRMAQRGPLSIAEIGGQPALDQGSDPVMVEIVSRRLQGIADAMGEMLRRTAVSVNVKQRLDFSCAVFDCAGKLLANAPHVPVHLGAMGHTVRHLMTVFPEMCPGDAYLSNDPYAGGSHLPDVTVVTPVFCDPGASGAGRPDFYVASRAHHAEIGGKTPGSMPPDGRCLAEEGVVIGAMPLRRRGEEFGQRIRTLLNSGPYPSRASEENMADIAAQRAAGVAGARRVQEMVRQLGRHRVDDSCQRLLSQAAGEVERFAATLTPGARQFVDQLDDGTQIAVRLAAFDGRLQIDFEGTSPVHPGCFNATEAIVTAATLYVLRTLIGGTLPLNDGIMTRVDLRIPRGLLNPPAGQTPELCPAVVAGNVETSMRLVDVLLGAFGVAAASQGTMNNVLIGDERFGYYETIGGGAGATPQGAGASGVHCHMSNTRITDPEVYESRYPVRLWQFKIRTRSGGAGLHPGGDGLIRQIEFLRPLTLSLLTSRRGTHRPWGLAGGGPGAAGRNLLLDTDGQPRELPASVTLDVRAGQSLRIETPGGGGWGDARAAPTD